MLLIPREESPRIAALLQAGKVGVLPSDTVYGLMASARMPEAVQRLYDLKHREKKTGTVIAHTIDQLVELGLKRRYLTAVERYWPGAVSVEIPCGPELNYIHQGLNRFAARLPADEQVRSLLQYAGPLMTSSANDSGQPTATTVQQAMDIFGDSIDFYVDGGDLSNRPPSTVIRVVDDAIEIIREGAVKINENGEIIQ